MAGFPAGGGLTVLTGAPLLTATYDGVTDNWFGLQAQLFAACKTNTSGNYQATQSLNGLVAISKPLVIPPGLILGGVGDIEQALDAGSAPLPAIVGSGIVPVSSWAPAVPNTILTTDTITGAAGSGVITVQSTTGFGTYNGSPVSVGNPATYIITTFGGVLSGTYTGVSGSTLTGSSNGSGVHTHAAAAIQQAFAISNITIAGTGPYVVTVTTSINHGYYAGQPVFVVGAAYNATAPTFQVNGSWCITSVPSPTTFTYVVSGNPTGSGFSSLAAAATGPIDCLTFQGGLGVSGSALSAAQYSRIVNVQLFPGTTVSRGNHWGNADSKLEHVLIYGGISACHDSDSNVPVNSTRSSIYNECYFEQPSTNLGYSYYEWGNNWRVTDLYKTGGTVFLKGGNCTIVQGHYAGGGAQGGLYASNIRILKNDDISNISVDSFHANGSQLISNEQGAAATNPAAVLSNCSYYNSTNSSTKPVFKNIPPAGVGANQQVPLKITGNHSVDAAASFPFGSLLSNFSTLDKLDDIDMSPQALSSATLFVAGTNGGSYPGFQGLDISTAGVPYRTSQTVSSSATTPVGAASATPIQNLSIANIPPGVYNLAATVSVTQGASAGAIDIFAVATAGAVSQLPSCGGNAGANNPICLSLDSTILVTSTATIVIQCYDAGASGCTVQNTSPAHAQIAATTMTLTPLPC